MYIQKYHTRNIFISRNSILSILITQKVKYTPFLALTAGVRGHAARWQFHAAACYSRISCGGSSGYAIAADAITILLDERKIGVESWRVTTGSHWHQTDVHQPFCTHKRMTVVFSSHVNEVKTTTIVISTTKNASPVIPGSARDKVSYIPSKDWQAFAVTC